MGLAPLRQGLFVSSWASQITGQSLTMVQGCMQQRWDFLRKKRLGDASCSVLARRWPLDRMQRDLRIGIYVQVVPHRLDGWRRQEQRQQGSRDRLYS